MADERAGGLRGVVVSGVAWKLVSQAIGMVVNFGTTLVLVRFLVPRDFGVAAMVIVFGSLGMLIANVGLGAVLVQREELSEQDRSTAFWTSSAIGLVLTLIAFAAASPVSRLFHEPRVRPLLEVFSLAFVINGVGVTQGSLLIREFRFRALELRTVASSVTGAVTAVVIAVLGYGAWAIIVQGLVTGGVSTVLLWTVSGWRPRFTFARASLRSFTGYSSYVFGSNLFFYSERNADNFIIGRFAGAGPLGIYTVAYNAMLVPLVRLASPIQQVFFPALSRIREPRAVGEIWLRLTRLVSALIVPAFVGIAVVAPEFVRVVLGEKWVGATRILEILAWPGILQAIAWQTQSVLLALDRASTHFRYAAVSSVSSVASFAVGLHWGIVGVATAYALVSTALAPYCLWLGCRAVGMPLRRFARDLVGVALAAAMMGGGILLLRLGIGGRMSAGPKLALLVVTGLVLYAGASTWLVPELRAELGGLRRARRSDAS